jgi:hypothetical protein
MPDVEGEGIIYSVKSINKDLPKPGNHGTTASILIAGLFPAIVTAARITKRMSS